MLEKLVPITLPSLLLILMVSAVLSQSEKSERNLAAPLMQDQNANIENFLREDEELRSVYQCRFTGQFVEIPPSVRERLGDVFPEYQFRIAEMEILIDLPWKKTKLIVVTSKEDHEVIAFIWGGMWTMPSKSFDKLIYGETVASLDAASKRVVAFAELLADTGPLRVGERTVSAKRIEVDILTREDNSVFRKLRLEIKNRIKLGRLLILRQDGKRITAGHSK